MNSSRSPGASYRALWEPVL